MNFFAALWQTMTKPFRSAAAPRVLTGARYPWTATVVGDDIVVTNQKATWFGGRNDPEDSGITASGFSTIAHPELLGCSLPMDLYRAHDNPCVGSPLPFFPWKTGVLVTNRANGRQVLAQLVELGPSAPPLATAAIDLMQSTFVALGGDLKAGSIRVDFKILGGAKCLT